MVTSVSLRVAGDDMDDAIIQYEKNYNILVGPLTAEQIKIKLGSAFELEQERKWKSRDVT